jgi:hypothetical protein
MAIAAGTGNKLIAYFIRSPEIFGAVFIYRCPHSAIGTLCPIAAVVGVLHQQPQ